jgi:hypothetical protein
VEKITNSTGAFPGPVELVLRDAKTKTEWVIYPWPSIPQMGDRLEFSIPEIVP